MSVLPPAETDEEIKAVIRRDWEDDREAQELVKLAHALGVGEIILANCIDDIRGMYFNGSYYARRDRQVAKHDLKSWELSRRQHVTVSRELASGRDVILVAYQSSGDFPATLAHEIGHYIIRRFGGLNQIELGLFKLDSRATRVTENMRRVARYDERFFENRNEWYAETWSRFLCGDNKRTLIRYLDRPLRRIRMSFPEKARLIEEHRARFQS